MQIWKDIPDYEGYYQVSNLGQVRTFQQSSDFTDWKILKPTMDKDCYLSVTLTKNGERKAYKIHRLVISTFSPITDEEKLEVNHINEIRYDNRLENLEWITHKENSNFGNRNVSIGKAVYCINLNKWFPSASFAARETGVNNGSICQVCKGNQKQAGNMDWKYMTYEEAIQIKAIICK